MDTNKIKLEIDKLERQLKAKRESLLQHERSCCHRWGEVKPDHIYTPGYTIPGDEPGTMGVDFRGPCYVPAETKQRWKRTCLLCGKVEHTTRTATVATSNPVF